MNRNRRPEILAPAGSMEALEAALRTGADAVYIGGKRFSARNSAANFDNDELYAAARKCHLYGAKLYLAVNTLIADSEADDFCDYIKTAAKAGVDAFIVQDWGCAELIRKCIPDAVLHASTQMSVHTAAGAEMLSELGYERVVPARELPKRTIKKICEKNIETEVFVHGALCMSVSGQCCMSAVIGSRSANRGCCGQACRLPFSAVGNMEHSALSLKDLSLIPIADELAETGVDSLKIEGRMKRPEYTAAAVNELCGAFDGKKPDMEMLRGIFSRSGFTDGYFTDKRRDMFGVREKEDVIAARSIIPKIHEMYRFERKAHSINFHAVIQPDAPVSITASSCGFSVTETDVPPQTAINRPTDHEMIVKQLSKLGDTVFSVGEITSEIADGLIVPSGRLNDLRRRLADKLSELITDANTPQYSVTDFSPEKPDALCIRHDKLPVRTFCRTAEQAAAAAELSEYTVIPHSIADSPLLSAIGRDRLIVSPPRFITNEDRLITVLSELRAKGFTHLLCHTPDCIAIGRKLGFTLHGSFSLNVFNSFTADKLARLGLCDLIVSFEATTHQINAMHSPVPLGAVIYGRLPLMLTRSCPIKNEVGCGKCTGHLTDRTGRIFLAACSGEYTEILNSDTLYMADRLDSFSSVSFGAVLLNDEDAEQTRNAVNGMRPHGKVTNGLYKRGVL